MARENTVGIRDLKNQLSRVVARVRLGREIIVTDRGAAVARLVPMGSGRGIDQLIAEGLVEAAPARRIPRRKRPRVRLRGRGPSIGAYVTDQRR